jgi:hypothetical protein
VEQERAVARTELSAARESLAEARRVQAEAEQALARAHAEQQQAVVRQAQASQLRAEAQRLVDREAELRAARKESEPSSRAEPSRRAPALPVEASQRRLASPVVEPRLRAATPAANPLPVVRMLPPQRAAPQQPRVRFSRARGEEQVWVPLGGQNVYRLDSDWAKSVVLLSGGEGADLPAEARLVNGEVVSAISTAPLRSSVVRIVIELSRPATPTATVIEQDGNRYLRVSFLL